MSNDVITLAIVKPEIGWAWLTSSSLPLFIVHILDRNGDIFYSLDKILGKKTCHMTRFTIYL